MNSLIDQDGLLIVTLSNDYGVMENHEIEQFQRNLTAGIENRERPRVIVDLTATSYIGSTFLEALINIWQKLKDKGGQMVLCGLQPGTREVVSVTRLDTLWPLYETRQAAIQALSAGHMEPAG